MPYDQLCIRLSSDLEKAKYTNCFAFLILHAILKLLYEETKTTTAAATKKSCCSKDSKKACSKGKVEEAK